MAYFTPYIDDTGIHIPTYQDIIEYYVAQAKLIFGSDIYLGIDSQDYQMYSIIARSAEASLQAAVDSYNARNPDTAFDDTLDGLVTINGIERKPATYSTVSLDLTGLPYTLIQGGVVQSDSGDRWNLPNEVVLDSTGKATVTAIAQQLGATVALSGEITTILTPTYGWSTVINPNAANVGRPQENNAELKERRKVAVATPSQTELESLTAGIDNVLGVTDFAIYENDTKVTDARGLPGNSICAVVEGGTNEDIVRAIGIGKNMGVLSYGDVTLPYTNRYNTTLDISFFRPEYVPVYIEVNIKPLAGYTTEVGTQIKEAIADYFSELRIGNNLYSSQLWEAALSVSPDIKPYFSIDPVLGIPVGTEEGVLSLQDLIATYKQKFTVDVDNISIELPAE